MARDEKRLALRAALRRGVVPVNVDDVNAAIAAKTAKRFIRGNVSMRLKPPLTDKDIEEARARRRRRILEKA